MKIAVKKKTSTRGKTPKPKLVLDRVASFSEIRSSLNLRSAKSYKIHKLLAAAGK